MTTEMFPLRQYQDDAVVALGTAASDHAAAVMATGLGKTVIMSHVIKRHATERTLVLTHRHEIAVQNAEKISAVNPGLDVGVVGFGRNDYLADVIVASVPALALTKSRWFEKLPADEFSLGIADECHHAYAETWRRVMENYSMPWKGLTATMHREKSGESLGEIWDEIVYEKGIVEAVNEGWLVRPRGIRVRVKDLKLAAVASSRNGDYQIDDLEGALMHASTQDAIVRAYREHAENRLFICFAPTVATAHHYADGFIAAGIAVHVVTGETPTADRERMYADLKAGRVRGLINCMVLTEGFDLPELACAIMGRPTKNPGLYQQMLGRVLRPALWAGKRDALILDVAGATKENTLAALTDLFGKPVGSDPYSDEQREAAKETQAAADAEDFEDTSEYELEFEFADLIKESSSVWLMTKGGTPFIPTDDKQIIFVVETGQPGLFNIGSIHQSGGSFSRRNPAEHPEAMPFDYAMAYAEAGARQEGSMNLSGRSAGWRRNPLPSDAQLNECARLRIEVPSGPKPGRRGEVSDLISVTKASNLIDRKVLQMRRNRGQS